VYPVVHVFSEGKGLISWLICCFRTSLIYLLINYSLNIFNLLNPLFCAPKCFICPYRMDSVLTAFFVRWEGRRKALFLKAVESLTFSVMLYVLITIFFIVGLVFFHLLPLFVSIIFLLRYHSDLLAMFLSKHIYISHQNRMLSKGDLATSL